MFGASYAHRHSPEFQTKYTVYLLLACAGHERLVLDVCFSRSRPDACFWRFLQGRHIEQEWNNSALWFRPRERAVQCCLAECNCSPFGRVMLSDAVISGSQAEGIETQSVTQSNMDIMYQLGPVQWTYPSTCTDTAHAVSGIERPVASPDGVQAPEKSTMPRITLIPTAGKQHELLVFVHQEDGCSGEHQQSCRAENEIKCDALERLQNTKQAMEEILQQASTDRISKVVAEVTAELDSADPNFPTSSEKNNRDPAVVVTPVPDSESPPRLVIAETQNPGFVLLYQERRADCPHHDRLIFSAEKVRKFHRTNQLQKCEGAAILQQGSGPSCHITKPAAPGIINEYDEVVCIHVPLWWFSEEFFTRQRRYDWPPENIRADIRQFGLHLVPVGAHGSPTRSHEFRLSFSRAEVVVISQMTEKQRSSLVAFKLCKSYLGDEGKAIKSYYAKTALMWLCEHTGRDEWTGITDGILKIVDFLDRAVEAGSLPCFFWSRINLLRAATADDRSSMRRALDIIRKDYIVILAGCLNYETMLPLPQSNASQSLRLSENEVRVWLARDLILDGLIEGARNYVSTESSPYLMKVLPALLRSYPAEDVDMLFHQQNSHWLSVQIYLFQALLAAPDEVARKVRLSSSEDGGLVLDAAPLMALLTEQDRAILLKGSPDTVDRWLRELPESERPVKLPAQLVSDRDLCDLILNIPLYFWMLKERVPRHFYQVCSCFTTDIRMTDTVTSFIPTEEYARNDNLRMADFIPQHQQDFMNVGGLDHSTALAMAHTVREELRQVVDNPLTLREHRRMQRTFSDPWRISRYQIRPSC